MLLAGREDFDMKALAKQVGVSEGLLYYHFGNRRGLLRAVVNDFDQRFDAAVAAVPYPGRRWIDRELTRTKEAVRFFYEDPVAPRIVDVVLADPALQSERHERQQRLIDLGGRNIAQAQRNGELPRQHDPRMLVAMLLGGVSAGIAEALSRDPPKPLAQAQREACRFVERASGLAQEEPE
jgi:AcrR family transcriptional regulator